jgi:hypothetical protein
MNNHRVTISDVTVTVIIVYIPCIFVQSNTTSLVLSHYLLAHNTASSKHNNSPSPIHIAGKVAVLCSSIEYTMRLLNTCTKCSLKGGKVLARRTWYNHNLGGKNTKLPNLSLEEINRMMNLPTPELMWRHKKCFEAELAELRTQIFKRAAGSSNVRMVSNHNICTIV